MTRVILDDLDVERIWQLLAKGTRVRAGKDTDPRLQEGLWNGTKLHPERAAKRYQEKLKGQRK